MKRLDITGVLEEGPALDIERPWYSFKAICTSNQCRSDKSKVVRTSTGPGVIKNVPKTSNQCPDCEDFLFWEKTRTR